MALQQRVLIAGAGPVGLVAAAWRGERGGGEEQQDEGKEEAAALPHPRILSRNDPPVISQPPRLALRVWHVADVSR